MNARNDFSDVISGWLEEQAGRGAPDYLDETLARSVRTRQRPAWSSLERWLPMETTFSARLSPLPRFVSLLALLAVLALAAAALLALGVGQRRLPHFGAAANGQIAFVDGDALKAASADATNVRTLTSLPNGAERLSFSPDGTHFAYRTTGFDPTITVTSSDGSNPVIVARGAAIATGDPIAWAPDSRRLAFTALVSDDTETVELVNADGSHAIQLFGGTPVPAVDRFGPAWSPDGAWVSFFSRDSKGSIALNLVHPDGTGEQRLATSPMNPDIIDVSWSPDPTIARLVYVAGGNVDMFDLATAKETFVATGFWPTWSPDGQRLSWWDGGPQAVPVEDMLAGRARPIALFPPYGSGACGEHPEAAGRSICGPLLWSPDGRWVYGPDVLGTSILIARSDRSGTTRTISLDHPIDVASGPGSLAWQPIAP
jgi:WD40 repeat protein